MYLQFFNLREPPFNLTPDPRFLFLSLQHEEALSHLLYGIYERKGFIEISGEVGTGKTVLCRALLERLDTTVSTALIFNSYLTEIELLQAITSDFGLTPGDTTTRTGYIDALNTYLLAEFAAGRNAVVLIDEAQNLEPTVLEQLRMLSNLETDRGKLLQVVLVGQPELHAKLATPQMRQLEQRIAVRFHLHELSRRETEQYMVHRLSVAGASHTITWTRSALRLMHQHCGGIPRRINVLCDRLLMSAYVHETFRISARLVRESLRELGGSWHTTPTFSGRWLSLLGKGLFAGLAGGGALALCVGIVLTFSSFAEQVYPRFAESVSALSRLLPQPTKMALHEHFDPVTTELPVAVSAQSPSPLPEVDVTLARMLWHLKTQIEDTLARPPQGALVPWHTILQDSGSTTGIDVIPLQAKAWHLQNVSRPCFLEVLQEMTLARATLWVLVKVTDDQAWLYQEPEGVVRMPLGQVQQRWSGKLYLTMESGKYRGFAIRPGMQGERVRVLQETLREKGYSTGTPSGQFDAQTQQAVKRFQRDNQLLADGYVGRQTLLLLLHFGGDMLAQMT